MGEAWPQAKEHILCLLPFPQDEKILAGIKEKHPNVEFTYKQIFFALGKALDLTTVPDGKCFLYVISTC